MAADTAASPAAEETSAQARLMDEYRGTAVGAALGAEYDSVTASKPKHRRAGTTLLTYQDLPLPGTALLEQAPCRLMLAPDPCSLQTTLRFGQTTTRSQPLAPAMYVLLKASGRPARL
jgi:hypothetical protein